MIIYIYIYIYMYVYIHATGSRQIKMAAERQEDFTKNGSSLQQWYQIYEEVLSFSLYFLPSLQF